MKRCKKLTKIQSDELNKLISSADSSGKEVRRAQAILMLNDGGNSKTIVVVTKYQRRRIYELRKQYLKKGLVAILDKRKGSPKTVLTKKERKEIVKALQTKTPKDYGYNNEHWTTILLGHFIEKQYKIKYKSRTSYYLLFRGAKFTYHKP